MTLLCILRFPRLLPGTLGNFPGCLGEARDPVEVAGAAEKAMIQQLTGTDEAADRCCLIGLQVLIKRAVFDF